MRRLTEKAWFGPKKYLGWGWTLQTWQGAVVSAVFVAIFIAAMVVMKGPARFVAAVVILAAFLGVVLLTGDPPGGPRPRSRQ